MNIQYAIGKGFGCIEIVYYIVVNAYFGPRRTNIPHATPNYGPWEYKFEIDYSRQTCFSRKMAHIWEKLEKELQEVMYSSKNFNYTYMAFVGYDTCDKLI